ncbi:GerAB/ArcD/ProY family transporter [Cohnella hongkongensis]|uniref:Endospore germination permease n=1 Tax=Cohnella hongkongensis TaxID=178337 RepID=A0ABV9FDN8_9BACL
MTANKSANITTLQFACLISGLQIGIAYLSLPRLVAEGSGTDGWMTILIMWLLSVMASIAAVRLMRRMPEGTVLDLISMRIGKWAGRTAAVLFGLYFAGMAYDGFVRTTNITRSWLLPQTKSFVILILLLIPAYAIVKGGPLLAGRYAEFIFLLTCWAPLIFIYPLKEANWLNLLPILKEGIVPVLTGVKSILFSFIGFAATLFLYPNLKYKQYAVRGVVLANSMTATLYVWITIVCFAYFSPDEILEFTQPVIPMLKMIEFRVLERIEVPFVAFYLFIYSLTWIPSTYLTVFCSSWLLGAGSTRRHLQLFCLLLVGSSFFYFPSFIQNERLEEALGEIGAVMEYLFPTVLLLLFWAQDKLKRRA